MPSCFVPHCNHRKVCNDCKFVSFPNSQTDFKRMKIWIKNIRRKDRKPKKTDRVCSCHFEISSCNDKKNRIPTIFPFKKSIVKANDTVSILLSTAKQKPRGRHARKRKCENEDVSNPISPRKRKCENEDVSNPISPRKRKCENEDVSNPISHDINDFQCPVQDIETTGGDVETETHTTNDTGVDKATQTFTVHLQIENEMLRKEMTTLIEENRTLKKPRPFSWERIESNDADVLHVTGISKEAFLCVFETCLKFEFKYVDGYKPRQITFINQLLLTLMKLRLNLTSHYLHLIFCISHSVVSNVFRSILMLLHQVLYKPLMSKIPSRYKNKQCLPKVFQEKFSNCRIVIDATEIPAQVPKNLQMQSYVYSNYKHRTTVKVLIGIAPNGVITFCSDAYPGGVSDNEITLHSGILDQLVPGDLVISDKGFRLQNMLPAGVMWNTPPFLFNSQFTEEEIEETYDTAVARIHVERAIRRWKNFGILGIIRRNNFYYADEIVQTCAMLINFRGPLIKELDDKFRSTTTSNGSNHVSETFVNEEIDDIDDDLDELD